MPALTNPAFSRSASSTALVISVGNLTVGGTGKTPMVLWIAQRLLAEGKSVGILTRGYRGEPAPANRRSIRLAHRIQPATKCNC